MKTASLGLARVAALSAGMLLASGALGLAEEFANAGGIHSTPYLMATGRPLAAPQAYGYAYRRPSAGAGYGYGAYAADGQFLFSNDYPCTLSPGSIEHRSCDHQ